MPIKIFKKTTNTIHRFSASSLCVTSKNVTFVVWTPMWLHITEIERHIQFMKSVLGTLQNFLYTEHFAGSSNKEN